MPPLTEELDQTVQMIWSTMFDVPISRLPDGPDDGPDEVDLVTGLVHLEGAYEGAVLLRCPKALAVHLTTLIFEDVDTPPDADVRDAIGELSNMLAGNIKAVLPHPSRIGLPIVAFGSNYDLQVVGAEEVGWVNYDCEGTRFSVTLVRESEGTQSV